MNGLMYFIHWMSFGCAGLVKRINDVGDFYKAFIQNLPLLLEVFQEAIDVFNGAFSFCTVGRLF